MEQEEKIEKTITIMKPRKYIPTGVCAKEMYVTLSGDRIIDVVIRGGCNGYSQAMCKMLKYMRIEDAITILEGIKCGDKPTSCPDQLVKAIRNAIVEEDNDPEMIEYDKMVQMAMMSGDTII